MSRKPRKLSLKDCYDILKVNHKSSLDDVKTAYRHRAFELHPDLNPNDPDASRKFQLLNEAYVALSAMLKAKGQTESSGKKQTETKKDTGASRQQSTSQQAQQGQRQREQADKAYAEQDVLRDLLNDPFARRVFEDIYSELNRKQADQKTEAKAPKPEPEPTKAPTEEKKPSPQRQQPTQKIREPIAQPAHKNNTVSVEQVHNDGVGDKVKSWLRKQIDEELLITLPPHGLVPGRKVRLQIRHGLSNEPQTIEVTIPQGYVVGKPIRLKGLGKHVGPWQGDLYLYLQTK